MEKTKCLICGYANKIGGTGFRIGFVHTECQAELATLKVLVREMKGIKFKGTFRDYYDRMQEILNRPEVVAIMKEEV